jgi:hypothetical protein
MLLTSNDQIEPFWHLFYHRFDGVLAAARFVRRFKV